MTDARIDARIGQVPVVAFLVAQRAHDDRGARAANVLADAVRVQRPQAEQEAHDAHHRGRYQHVRVEAEPREIQGDLHAEILLDVVERLVSVVDDFSQWKPTKKPSPFSNPHLIHLDTDAHSVNSKLRWLFAALQSPSCSGYAAS